MLTRCLAISICAAGLALAQTAPSCPRNTRRAQASRVLGGRGQESLNSVEDGDRAEV